MAVTPFDIANFNLMEFAQAYGDIFDSTPKNVDIQVMNNQGAVVTKTIANRGMFKKQIWDDVGKALGQFNRTFYVDADKGDDNNDGSSGKPFKTLQKAVDSIPVSGFVTINLVNNYTGVFDAHFKNIYIKIASGKTWNIPDGSRNTIAGCSILIENQGQINVQTASTDSKVNGDNYAGFFASNYEHFNTEAVSTTLYLINLKTNNPLSVGKNRSLFGSRKWGNNQNIALNLAVYTIFTSGNMTLDGKLLSLNNGVGTFQWTTAYSNNFKVVDSKGNTINIGTTVSGIIKDKNGVPRNISSNIIF